MSVAAIYPSMTSEYVIGEQSPQNLTADECQSFVLAANSETFNLNVSSVTAVIDPVNVANCNATAYNLTLPSVPTWNESAAAELIYALSACIDDSVPKSAMYCLANSVEEQCGVMVRWLPLVIFSASLGLKAIVACLAILFLPHFKKRLYNNLGDVIYFAIENPDSAIANESLCSKRRQPNQINGI